MEIPEKLFNKVWVLDRQGKLHKAKVKSAKGGRIEVYSNCNFLGGTLDFSSKDGKVWDCFDKTLLFDLDSEESKRLIEDRVAEYSKKVQDDYQKAFEEYHKCMSKIAEITQSNLKMMNEEV